MTYSRDRTRKTHADFARQVLELARARRLRPGDHLPEQQFADMCGVSRTPMRATFKILLENGFLMHRPDGGYFLAADLESDIAEMERQMDAVEGSLVHRILADRTARRLDDLRSVSFLIRRNGSLVRHSPFEVRKCPKSSAPRISATQVRPSNWQPRARPNLQPTSVLRCPTTRTACVLVRAAPYFWKISSFAKKIFHFDHERFVHARGSAAHGYFEGTDPIPELSRAGLFAEKGKRTPLFARFSTVAGGAGSVDTPRDVRGFAGKFHTDEGNCDLVGNTIPVFFTFRPRFLQS